MEAVAVGLARTSRGATQQPNELVAEQESYVHTNIADVESSELSVTDAIQVHSDSD